MKKFLFFIAVSSLMSLNLCAATPAVNPLSIELPAGDVVLPEPPEVGSFTWLDDSLHYFQARELRRAVRAVTKEDSALLALLGVTMNVGTVTTVDSLIAKKREPYISWLKTYGADPAINLPLHDATIFPKLVALDELCEDMKEYGTDKTRYRVRQRPYYYFHDYYSGGKLKESTTEDSYPSGHGYFAGLFGLCMSYIDPSHVKEVKANCDSFCEQRLILGAHWKSDMPAGQVLGAITFGIALNDDTFRTLLEEARQELADYRAQHEITTSDSPLTESSVQEVMKHIVNGQVVITSHSSTYSLQGSQIW